MKGKIRKKLPCTAFTLKKANTVWIPGTAAREDIFSRFTWKLYNNNIKLPIMPQKTTPNPCANRFIYSLVGLATVSLLPNSGFAADSPQQEEERPNILFIMADDHTSQAWGCYGSRLSEYAPTQNIDRLRRQGALLQNCFCTNSISVPSRASILTGQYGHLNGAKTLRGRLDPQKDHVAKQLRDAGYQTAL